MDEWFLEILWICCFCGLDHVSRIDHFNLDFYSKKTSYLKNVCKSTRQALETPKCPKQLETKNYFKIILQAYEKSFQMIKFHFSWKRKSEDKKKKTCEKSSNWVVYNKFIAEISEIKFLRFFLEISLNLKVY